jgi:hypothetical protein
MSSIDHVATGEVGRPAQPAYPPPPKKTQRIWINHMGGPGGARGGPDPRTPPASYAAVTYHKHRQLKVSCIHTIDAPSSSVINKWALQWGEATISIGLVESAVAHGGRRAGNLKKNLNENRAKARCNHISIDNYIEIMIDNFSSVRRHRFRIPAR